MQNNDDSRITAGYCRPFLHITTDLQLHIMVYNNLSVKFVEDEISKLLEQKCRIVNELASVNTGDQSAYFDGLDREEQQALLDKYVSSITVDIQRKKTTVIFEDGLQSCLEKAGCYA